MERRLRVLFKISERRRRVLLEATSLLFRGLGMHTVVRGFVEGRGGGEKENKIFQQGILHLFKPFFL